ncbi:MAG: hypothetical protein JWN66_4127 [Sphingomonas bacterium]|uniref:S8 family peptidase n=1 Tax=Sphingomonas bacterium TaxID=1895847 RepID=UPI00260A8479|nr:S8 family serine peptidase [Sphingomonas bacterium]MDB5707011.1 hypothetical protein [Sphingomonas bacterium]
MNLRRAGLLALLAICAASAALIVPRPAQAQEQKQADDGSSNRILVMLRLTPAHFRPNASYGGAYGDSGARAARRRIAERIARENGFELVDGWPMPLIGVDCFVMKIAAGVRTEDAVDRVSRDSRVAWAEPMQVYRARGEQQREGDPLYAVQPSAGAWRLADLHRVATGRGVTVAIVDSKIEVGHPDLAGQFVANQDFAPGHSNLPEQHGTGIAGVIGAKAGNSMGIAGVAPGARMMALRACWQTGNTAAAGPTLCDSLSLAKALHYAIDHGVQVINLSLSGPPDRLLGSLIDIAVARKTSVVAAFDPTMPNGGFPASQPGVVAVAEESLPSIPLAVYGAPGRDVPTTQPGGKWYFVNGSSYAAAHVSGLLALVRQQRGVSARPMLVATHAAGGEIDACATLVRTSKACDCSCAVARQVASPKRR